MAKENKSGLGRGLSSLIGGYEASFKSETEDVSRETVDNKQEVGPSVATQPQDDVNVSRETVTAEDYLKDVSRETDNNNQKVGPSLATLNQDDIKGKTPQSQDDVRGETSLVQDEVEGVSRETSAQDSNVGPSVATQPQDDVRGDTAQSQDNTEVVSRETQEVVSEKAINTEEAEPQVFIREVTEEKPAKEEEKAPELVEIEVDLIEPNPDQPRMNFDEQKLQELAHSIKDQGVLQPIVVRENGDMFQIIAGERRWQASRIAGLETIPCVIQQVDDDKALELGLIENIQRDDLNPIEEAYTYKRLMDKMNYTQAELAKAVAKGRSTIANAIRLLDLPEEAQEAMFNKKLTAGHARAILSVPSAKGRKKLTDKIIQDKLTVREAESLARLLLIDTSSNVKRNTNNIPAAYTAMAKSLKEVLKTQVRVKKTKTGSKLEIAFKNEEELRKIYEKLAEE